MTRTLARLSAVLLAAVQCAGCAAHRSDHSSRFVKRGEPAVKAHEPEQPASDSLEQYVAKIRTLAERARPAPSNPLPTVEGKDRKLAAALLLAAAAPTAESLRSVRAQGLPIGG